MKCVCRRTSSCNPRGTNLAKHARLQLVIISAPFFQLTTSLLTFYCKVDARTQEEDTPIFCGRFFLTYYSRLCIFSTPQSNVLSPILPILELFLETKFSLGRKAQFEAPGPNSYTYTSAFTYPWQALSPGGLVSPGELV